MSGPWRTLRAFMLLVPLAVVLVIVTLLQWAGRMRASVPLLERAVKWGPYNLSARIWLGDTYALLGRWEEAGESYVAAYAIDPENDELPAKLKTAFAKTGRPESAVEELTDVLLTSERALLHRESRPRRRARRRKASR